MGDETTGVVGGTISTMALVYCRSVKILSTIPVFACVCVCVCVCECVCLGDPVCKQNTSSPKVV